MGVLKYPISTHRRWGMKEKITWFILITSGALAIIVYGLEIAIKIWGLIKMINFDAVFILRMGLLIILIGSGIIYFRERMKNFKNRCEEDKGKLDKLQKVADEYTRDITTLKERLNQFDVKKSCFTVIQLQDAISEARKERAEILSKNNNTYNQLTGNIEKIGQRQNTLERAIGKHLDEEIAGQFSDEKKPLK
jgi:prefoldin subunit 5